ncbi:MAG TPA: glycosyltransferase family 39 protein [Candidatus Eisenbacteria bacterium]|jgi:tetratricopeptide (TPR) repeat protein|nr:glycosyltransferase family 39 protein [Candidatus Eisenbacteria bacterium]
MSLVQSVSKPADFFNRYRVPILIFSIAFLIRLFHLADISDHPSFAPTMSDLEYYDQTARQIIAHDGPTTKEPFFRAPLYSYFLALLYSIFGHNLFAAMFVQILIGSGSCVLIYRLGRRLFDERIGKIAGFLAAFYGVFVYYDADFELPAVEIFLTLVLMNGLLSAIEKPSFRKSFWLGILTGLTAIHRPNILAYGLCVPLIFLFYYLKSQGWRTTFRHGAIFVLAMFVFPALTTLRNYVVSHDPVFICYQDGLNFYLSNNPDANGAVPYMPGMGGAFSFRLVHEMAERESGRKLTWSQESRFWTRKGMAFIRERPRHFVKMLAKKFVMFWNGYEIHNNRDVYQFKKNSKILDLLVPDRFLWMYLPFGLAGPLALMGLAFSAKSARRYFFIYVFILVYMASCVAFFVPGRFRAPVIPYLLLFVAYALSWFYDKITSRHQYLEIYFTMLLFLVVLMNLPPMGKIGPPKMGTEFPLATEYMRKGEFDKAIAEFEKAIAARPFDPYYLSTMGEAYLAKGDKDKALEIFKKGREKFPFYPPNQINSDRLEQEMHPMAYEAHKHIDLSLQLQHREKDMVGAERELRKAIEIDPNDSMSYAMLGVFFEHDANDVRYGPGARLDKAVGAYVKAVELDDKNAEAHYNLALLYDRFGLEPPAVAGAEYQKYLQHRPDGQFADFAKMRLTALRPFLSEAVTFQFYYRKAIQLLNEGRIQDSEQIFARALLSNPNTEESSRMISEYTDLKAKKAAR